jgi:preprotein translocase subunit SecE
VARNRKRSKERRSSRRPVPGPGARPGVATARGARDDATDAPAPLEHATPDAELAEAQLARGRDEEQPAGRASHPAVDEGAVYTDEVTQSEADDDADAALVPASGGAPAPRGRPVHRLVTFLQGSWRELQRVQWPDRRQVMQATGVVIGFVVVAGLYLGLADTVAAKLADLILK